LRILEPEGEKRR